MSVNEVLRFIVQVFFVLLSAVALFDYIRHPNRRRRDFALFSNALGIPLGIALVDSLFGYQSDQLDLVGALVLFAQPYFLFRLLQYYRPIHRWLHWLVLAGIVACWVALYFYIETYPAMTQVGIFGFSAVVDAFCAWQFSRGVSSTTGTLRRRLLLITVGAGLFALALAASALRAVVPSVSEVIRGIALALTAISAILYYVAFVPPRWIRYAWQFEDLSNFLSAPQVPKSSKTSSSQSFQHLASAANQGVNGMMGSVFQKNVAQDSVVQDNEQTETWAIRGATDETMAANVLTHALPTLELVWQNRKPLALHIPEIRNAEERKPFQTIGGLTWLLVPIVSAERTWGVLLVILQDRSLFIDDDLALLALFAQQAAMLQENHHLIAELQGYSQQLVERVESRTRELRESEAALLELNASLEQRVEQRTAELQQRNDELDSFAYVASHDLKAPLRAINHLAMWIEEDAQDKLPEATRQHLAKLRGRVRRMENLLNDLLAYSRVGRQRHPTEPVNIVELIDDVREVVAPPPGFTIKINADLVVETERIPLETIFRNLIGNAIKHHDRVGEGQVEIHAHNQRDYVKFTVSDNGPGIASEYHQRIFDIFTTLIARDQVEASGIGLAIVKKSIESRGGAIWVESAVGEGTTIHFTWPQNGADQANTNQTSTNS